MAGRGKKTQLSEAELKKADALARKGHKNYTICKIMGWSDDWLESRPDIQERMRKNRALHADDVISDQNRIRKSNLAGAATMAMMQGKQPEKDGGLGQIDKVEVGGSLGLTIMPPIEVLTQDDNSNNKSS
jgi:hypothetical protein